jgi:hypothetical protein
MIDRQIDSPMPMPPDLVVWNGSKSRSTLSPASGILHSDEDAAPTALLASDQQLARPAHRFDGVED